MMYCICSGAIIKCEELPVELCAFSVSSSGNRCVLEKDVMMNDTLQFECQVTFNY